MTDEAYVEERRPLVEAELARTAPDLADVRRTARWKVYEVLNPDLDTAANVLVCFAPLFADG